MVRLSWIATTWFIFQIANCANAQEIAPDRIGFDYATLRKLLPEDGKLIEKGEISKDYIGLALGHEVAVKENKVQVGAKLGSPGIVFGDGYVKLHFGAHVEVELKGVFSKPNQHPTLAFDIVAHVIATVDDSLKVHLHLTDEDIVIRGENTGGSIAVSVYKGLCKAKLHQGVLEQAEHITRFIHERKPPTELQFVTITPSGIEFAKTRPEKPPQQEVIVNGKWFYHITTDDREGGIVKNDFFSNEGTKFAEVPSFSEYPAWKPNQKVTIHHKFDPPIPLRDQMAFARVSLTEANEINVGWNFEATLTLTTNTGRMIVFEGKNLRLDTTGKSRGGTAKVDIPRVR
jgi:hypothetical protein